MSAETRAPAGEAPPGDVFPGEAPAGWPAALGTADAWTDDAVLNGRLRLLQPRRGHRFGHDAVLLAAATPGRAGEHAVDLGAGVGAAGLLLAARVPGLRASLVEIEPALAVAATENARRNGLGDRVDAVALDVEAASDVFAAAGLAPGGADRVLTNPPFNDHRRLSASPDPERRRAHVAAADLTARWIAVAARLLRPGGTLTLIHPADRLGDLLAQLDRGFGAIAVLPIHGKPERPAIRVLVRAEKGGRAPLALWPGLVLTDAAGLPSAEAEAVLRGGATLPLAAS
ncbi:methyltransferase [Rhodoplanes serenus]|uniref:Methyltransferase n=1 Tax=Rhodoplanes serenus TaxID=200615 RepID=A0A9X4XL20_9BRAD|nr:methyltransferase [Rhodoplanes serenus]MTW14606.1 methyltransferase [Rhodoplanes serenus]